MMYSSALTAHHLFKSYNLNSILENVSFSVNAGEHLGLIGSNGCGKTTLLRILVGLETPDSGVVARTPSDLRLGYLPQGFEPDIRLTLGEIIQQAIGYPAQAESEVTRLASEIANAPERSDLQMAYDAALRRLEHAANQTLRVSEILRVLGLFDIPQNQPLNVLSGGQKTRLSLATVLLSDPQLLLLDEPTNHLDIAMLEWLEDWLAGFTGAALIVSHDRTFLDRTVNRILELDAQTHRLTQYAGNYSLYLEQKEAERKRQWADYTDWKEEIHQLQSAARHLRGIAKFRKGGKADSGDKFAKGFFAGRSAGTVARAKQLEHRVDALLTEQRVEKPQQTWQIKLDFGKSAHVSRDVLIIEELTIGYPGHPPLARDLNLHLRGGERIVLTGPNGGGKTTLLRTIAGQLPPIAGHLRLGQSVKLGYMSQEEELLDQNLTPFETIQRIAPLNETEERAFLHYFLFSGDDALRPVHTLSYGERARLILATLVAQGCNFLLLDEPINHLDIPSRTLFEQALARFEGTVLAVVHDRYFIDRFANEVWVLDNGQISHNRPILHHKQKDLAHFG
jgi:ATP-binding cassette subfamily F protein 3